jgi:multiple sugar transport system permease protein
MKNVIPWATIWKWLSKTLRYFIIYASAILIVFPIFWMFSTSVKGFGEVLEPHLLPRQFTLEHYRWVLTERPFLSHLKNSLFVSVSVVLVSISISSLGAYSVARFRYPGRKLFAQLVLFTYTVPAILLFIPIFIIIKNIGLLNKLPSLIIADTAFILPFCLWMLIGFVGSLPDEIEEAALIDGCSKLQAFWYVVLPLTAPGIVAAAMFAWVLSWNEFLFASTLINNAELKPLSTGLAWYMSAAVGYERWGPMVAEAVLYIIPGLIVFIFLQRYMVEGLTAGAVK